MRRSSARSSGPGSSPTSVSARRASPYALECLGLPSSAVQGDHQLTPCALAQGLGGNHGAQLGNELAVRGLGEPHFDELVAGDRAQLTQTVALRAGERVVGQLRERRTAHQGDCLEKQRFGSIGATCVTLVTSGVDQRAEAIRVDQLRRDAQLVAVPMCHQRRRAERSRAQARYVGPYDLNSVGRWA